MIKMLEEYIFDQNTGMCVTFNTLTNKEEYTELVDLALDILDDKKIIDSKNIKSFYIKEQRLIFARKSGLYYIQKKPNKGKTKDIIDKS